MSRGLLFECDEHVANWTFATFKMPKMSFDRAIGIVDAKGSIIGSVLFQCWNGFNVEMSYYGVVPTLSPGIIRCLARYVLFTFNVSRVTVSTCRKNRNLMRSLQRIGFRLEGAQRRFYGHRDCNRNTAIRFVMFRERIEQIATLPVKKEQKSC